MTPLPTTMHAVELTGFGDTDQLHYREDRPLPVPGAHEVLIAVGACGVNNTDIWTREGAYGADGPAAWQGAAFQFPRIQGADSVGRIVALGAQVPAQRLGQRVMVNPTLYGDGPDGLYAATYLGSERDGGFAQFVCVPSVNALAIDSRLSDAELATFMTSYLTAEHMLERAAVGERDTVLVSGASGGVGSALLQLTRLRGARVVAIVGQAKAAQLGGFGLAGVLWRDQSDYAGALLRQTGRASVDVVADVVAGERTPELLDLLRVGGRYVTAGAIAGARVCLDWRRIYLRQLTLFGCTMGTQAQAERIVQWVAQGRLTPLLAATYPLQQLAQAQIDFKRRAHVGKLVIVR